MSETNKSMKNNTKNMPGEDKPKRQYMNKYRKNQSNNVFKIKENDELKF